MARLIASVALIAAMAAPVFADVPPPKGKCSTAEENGVFLAACLLLAAFILILRAFGRVKLGRA